MSLPEIFAFDNRHKVVAITREFLAGCVSVIEAANRSTHFAATELHWMSLIQTFSLSNGTQD